MSDIYMNFKFPIDDPDKFQIDTNVKDDALEDVLGDVLHGQIGAGEDKSPPNDLDVYAIDIKIDLSNDAVSIVSDTGNKALTTGILLDIAKRLKKRLKTTDKGQ